MKKMEQGELSRQVASDMLDAATESALHGVPAGTPAGTPYGTSDAMVEGAPRVRVVRTDQRTRDLVNQAVASVPSLGLQRAAEFLASVNVPADVAVRTLMYPQRRRRG